MSRFLSKAVIVVSLFCAAWLASSSASAMQFPVELIETFDDSRVVAFVDPADIEASTQWTPAEGAVPLTIAGAQKTLAKHLKGDTRAEHLVIDEIMLKRIPHQGNHWHYLIAMTSTQEPHAPRHYYVVLMSGKVVGAIHEPASYK